MNQYQQPKETTHLQTDNRNEFDDISALMADQQYRTDAHIHDLVDPDLTKNEFYSPDKFAYYERLRHQNKQMYKQLKSLDRKLNEDIKELVAKKHTNVNNNKGAESLKTGPKVKIQRSKTLQHKYKELQMIKMEIEKKNLHRHSLAGLKDKVESLKAVIKQKYAQVEAKAVTLKKLTKMLKQKQQKESMMLNNSSVYANVYTKQIKELREQLKQKNDRAYQQKQRRISAAKSLKQVRNNSSLNIKQADVTEIEKQSPLIQQLKNKYGNLGKKIQALKLQKKALMQTGNIEQRKKYLEKLKNKVVQMGKV